MNRSDFLFATPSFLGGMASALDLGSTLTVYNESPTPKDADAMAMASDWHVTGDDIGSAMNQWSDNQDTDG